MKRPLPFVDFHDQWTPLIPSAELGARPRADVVAGVRVVLFRGGDGRAACVVDRCPHRGASLALGRVVDGAIECPFHGWRFQADGACAHVPFNPAVDRGRLAAVALPTVERGGLVWVYAGVEADEGPPVPPLLEAPDRVVTVLHRSWACHWTRAMENMLDFPHLPYVHRSSIGAGIRRAMTPESEAHLRVEDQPYGWRLHTDMPGSAGTFLHWLRPNGMLLELGFVDNLVWCVPQGPTTTRMLVAAVARRSVWNRLASWANRPVNAWILQQDKAVTESSDPPAVPPAADELSVATDVPTLRFRAWYFKHCKDPRPAGVEPAAGLGK